MTAYEMRISDWSSDVCSSDLVLAGSPDAPMTATLRGLIKREIAFISFNSFLQSRRRRAVHLFASGMLAPPHDVRPWCSKRPVPGCLEIGRASCRERVCQSV